MIEPCLHSNELDVVPLDFGSSCKIYISFNSDIFLIIRFISDEEGRVYVTQYAFDPKVLTTVGSVVLLTWNLEAKIAYDVL